MENLRAPRRNHPEKTLIPSTVHKLLSILTPAERRQALVLFGLMLAGMVLETLSIGLIIPAMTLLTQPGVLSRWFADKSFFSAVAGASESQMVISGMILLVCAYGVKTAFLAFLAWKQTAFTQKVQSNVSQRLFAGYMRQPYTFHLEKNSAQLIRNMTTQVYDVSNVVQLSLMMATEVLVMFGIAALLITVEPLGALSVVGILGLAGWSANALTRRYLARWGEARQYHEGFRIQHLQQGLGGVKDVKLLGREREFLKNYGIHTALSAEASRKNSTLQALPRLGLEMLAVCGLAVLICVMIWQGKPMPSLLPTLGLFAGAAFRFMPSVSRIIIALQAVRFSLPAIATIQEELQMLEPPDQQTNKKRVVFSSSICMKNVSFEYSGTNVNAIDNITLKINKGSMVGFIGGSGAGKSTLVDVLLGLLEPTSGSVNADDTDIHDNLRGWQDQIGYVPQTIYLTDDSLRKNVAFGLPEELIDEDAVKHAIKAAQLDEFVAALPAGIETEVGERGVRLSGGQRQRVGIARALYHNPEILVLDEATSALDAQTESWVMDSVRRLHGRKTIIIVAHRLSTVEDCDFLFQLDKGKLIKAGDAKEVLNMIPKGSFLEDSQKSMSG